MNIIIHNNFTSLLFCRFHHPNILQHSDHKVDCRTTLSRNNSLNERTHCQKGQKVLSKENNNLFEDGNPLLFPTLKDVIHKVSVKQLPLIIL